jgi:outer membrane lipoprotein-sorting protein
MTFLRTASTRRLLSAIAGVIAAIAVIGTAIAVAASGSGPVPPPKPLARAIHDALGGPQLKGITARISFTNHLIDSSNIQGSDPILTGATGRLWLSNDHRLRLELQSDSGDAQVVVNRGSFWVYDPSAKTVYEGTLPASTDTHHRSDRTDKLPSVAQIQRGLDQVARHVSLSGAIPSDVADHATYTVRVAPKHDGGLLGDAELAWDAVRGVPLRIAVYARGDSAPVLELKATNISYGPVSASDFAVSPPVDAKVVRVSAPASGSLKRGAERRRGRHQEIVGVAAVARRLPFGLLAPQTLVGLPRRSVTLLDWAGKPAALITYGQNLGGVMVIEHKAQREAPITGGGEGRRGLSLPTVSIDGVTGQELDTALGTMVRFTRADVSYTVIGSVPAAAADAAARAL